MDALYPPNALGCRPESLSPQGASEPLYALDLPKALDTLNAMETEAVETLDAINALTP